MSVEAPKKEKVELKIPSNWSEAVYFFIEKCQRIKNTLEEKCSSRFEWSDDFLFFCQNFTRFYSMGEDKDDDRTLILTKLKAKFIECIFSNKNVKLLYCPTIVSEKVETKENGKIISTVNTNCTKMLQDFSSSEFIFLRESADPSKVLKVDFSLIFGTFRTEAPKLPDDKRPEVVIDILNLWALFLYMCRYSAESDLKAKIISTNAEDVIKLVGERLFPKEHPLASISKFMKTMPLGQLKKGIEKGGFLESMKESMGVDLSGLMGVLDNPSKMEEMMTPGDDGSLPIGKILGDAMSKMGGDKIAEKDSDGKLLLKDIDDIDLGASTEEDEEKPKTSKKGKSSSEGKKHSRTSKDKKLSVKSTKKKEDSD